MAQKMINFRMEESLKNHEQAALEEKIPIRNDRDLQQALEDYLS